MEKAGWGCTSFTTAQETGNQIDSRADSPCGGRQQLRWILFSSEPGNGSPGGERKFKEVACVEVWRVVFLTEVSDNSIVEIGCRVFTRCPLQEFHCLRGSRLGGIPYPGTSTPRQRYGPSPVPAREERSVMAKREVGLGSPEGKRN